MKRKIGRKNYTWMKSELAFFEEKGTITRTQKDEMLAQYEVSRGVSLVRILVTVGALLLGAGIFSFIASNWIYLGKTVKFLIILASIAGVNGAAIKLENSHPKTARGLYFLGVLFFGAGIFLTGQIFNLGGPFGQAFLWWGIGSLPMAYVLKDKWLFIFATVLFLLYLDAENTGIGYFAVLITALLAAFLYWINEKMVASRLLLFFVNALSIAVLSVFLFKLNAFFPAYGHLAALLLLFVAGFVMLRLPVQEAYKEVMRLEGHLLHGLTGILLTFSSVWEGTVFGSHFNLAFSVVYFLLVLYFIKTGSLTNIFILCIFVLRFYLDFSYGFLPKSIVFIIGGLIFIGFGFYFEKQRKEGGNGHA